jgi:hypothetical protein
MRLTKIDVAEAHLISAVRLHFQCGPPASVYLLAGSAREILTTIGDKTGIRTMLHGIADDLGRPLKDLIDAAHQHVNFLKHANRDPQAVFEDFTENDVDTLLFVACHDLLRVAKGQPIEAQFFEAWCWWFAISWSKVAQAPLKAQPIIRHCIKRFKGIRSLSREEQLRLGWAKLQEAAADANLLMELQREVVLPLGAAS